MSVTLQPITPANFRQCINLKLLAGQEKFVAPNVVSIAQSKVSPHMIPLAVYDGDAMVGFTLHGRDPEDGRYWIIRVMIAGEHQNKGFGRAAMHELIRVMTQNEDCDAIYLSYVPGNSAAEQLYLRLGFERTDEVDPDGEIILRLSMT